VEGEWKGKTDTALGQEGLSGSQVGKKNNLSLRTLLSDDTFESLREKYATILSVEIIDNRGFNNESRVNELEFPLGRVQWKETKDSGLKWGGFCERR